MTTTRSLRHDERGASPFVLIASVAVFVVVSLGLAASLVASLQASGTMQVSSQLEESVHTAAREPVRQGYAAVAALPATATIDIAIGPFTGTAIRTVEVNAASKTARVTVAIGTFNGSEFGDASRCATAPEGCVIATELVAAGGTP